MASSSTPRLVLGLMTFGPEASKGGRILTQDEFLACLSLFNSAGHHELDTARVYCAGDQESWTAAALAEHAKQAAQPVSPAFSIATKCHPGGGGGHKAETLREQLLKSLAVLGSESVDIFYLHAADRATPFLETLREADKLHKEGKFKQLGLSNFSSYEVAEVCTLARDHGLISPTVYQGKYNALHRNLERELLPACRHYGLSMVAYNPLAGGLLSGKYTSATETPQDGGRFSDTAGGFGRMYRGRYFRNANFESLKILKQAIVESGDAQLTLVEIALRWLVHHSALDYSKGDGIVLGVSSESQLRANLDAVKAGLLPEKIVAALDEAARIAMVDEHSYWQGDLKYEYELE